MALLDKTTVGLDRAESGLNFDNIVIWFTSSKRPCNICEIFYVHNLCMMTTCFFCSLILACYWICSISHPFSPAHVSHLILCINLCHKLLWWTTRVTHLIIEQQYNTCFDVNHLSISQYLVDVVLHDRL